MRESRRKYLEPTCSSAERENSIKWKKTESYQVSGIKKQEVGIERNWRSKNQQEVDTSGERQEDYSLWRLSQEHGLQKLQNVQPSVFIEGLASVGTRQQVLALEDRRSAQCVTVMKSHAALRKYV